MITSEAEGRAEALRRIAVARETRARSLDLSGLMLTALPDAPGSGTVSTGRGP